ncbi:MAG: hypothetical protein IPJ32_16225 [Sphingobacteriaceae bacterium]|nr:hypothetical protein [Sphingobacteriaceae bacterium]
MPSAPPVITGTGVTTVTSSVNNFTINTPATKLTYTPSTGVLSYSPAIGINTINISPAVSFASGVLTIGPSVVTIPGTGIWTRPSSSVTTLTNANDNVGIGISTPNNRLHVVEAVNGIAAVNAVNTYSISSGSAMGLYASSSNPSSTSAGVYGTHSGGGNGVSGISSSTTFSNTAGVYGYAAGTLSTNVSVQADVSAGNSIGVFANSFASHNGLGLYSLKLDRRVTQLELKLQIQQIQLMLYSPQLTVLVPPYMPLTDQQFQVVLMLHFYLKTDIYIQFNL